MFKLLPALALSIGLLSVNSAWAYSYIACDWDPSPDLIPGPSLRQITHDAIDEDSEAYNCKKDEEGYMQCDYKGIWKIPNRIYATSQTVKINCINLGEKSETITYNFAKASEDLPPSKVWKNLTMSISGVGPQRTFSNIENMVHDKLFQWNDGSLAPCQKDCGSITVGWPRYTRSLTFNFNVRPKVTKVNFDDAYSRPVYDLQDPVGALWIISGIDKEVSWSTITTPYLYICGMNGKTVCNPSSSGSISGSGGGSGRPPIKQCTLTIVTPDVVSFQPISSDDLSRDRVRTEDFTLTVIKGPDQSTPCLGSAYNLPGEIKTQGGYPISSTFWGISHSSGAPQGIGLKLYDLAKGDYLRFNSPYPSFISDISSLSESKRIRAEISATTKDLKKIKDGTYSQVLTFEVKMP